MKLSEAAMSGDYDENVQWTQEQRQERAREIQALLEEENLTDDQRVNLALEQGDIFADDRFLTG
jgi:hypothetical protein